MIGGTPLCRHPPEIPITHAEGGAGMNAGVGHDATYPPVEGYRGSRGVGDRPDPDDRHARVA